MVYWYDIIEYIGSENRLVFRYLRFRETIVVLSCIFALTVIFENSLDAGALLWLFCWTGLESRHFMCYSISVIEISVICRYLSVSVKARYIDSVPLV